MGGWVDGDGWMDRSIDGWMNGWGQMDGWMDDGQMDRWMDG